jgi:hypothetical protein
MRPSASVSAWVRRIGRASSPSLYRETCTADGGHPRLGVEHVGRDRRCGVGHGGTLPRRIAGPYAHRHGTLRITVGDLAFTARWEPAAPQTIEAIRRMLPIDSKLIHCRWSGESTWIPYGEFRPGIDYENHTSHPAPGMLAMYPGGISECEIFFPYGACTTASKVGQLAANHFASIEPDDGWADRLREVGGERSGRARSRSGSRRSADGRLADRRARRDLRRGAARGECQSAPSLVRID